MPQMTWREKIGLAIFRWLVKRGPHTRAAIVQIADEETMRSRKEADKCITETIRRMKRIDQ